MGSCLIENRRLVESYKWSRSVSFRHLSRVSRFEGFLRSIENWRHQIHGMMQMVFSSFARTFVLKWGILFEAYRQPVWFWQLIVLFRRIIIIGLDVARTFLFPTYKFMVF